MVRQGKGLSVAHHLAWYGFGCRFLRGDDDADQEHLSRRNPQAICADRARQRLERESRAVLACVSLRFVSAGLRFSGCLLRCFFCWQPLDRNVVLVCWFG